MIQRISLVGITLLALSACVGPDALRRAEDQLAAGQWEGAIASFNEVSKLEPANAEYRAATLRATEKATNALLLDAAAASEKQPAQASEIYQRILRISPKNESAAKGLLALETTRRHQRLFDDAARAANGGREQEARAKYKKLLLERPNHGAAKEALQAMDEKAGRPSARVSLDPALRKPVTLEFRDASVKMVFDALAASTGINFVFDRDLKLDARITVFLRNVAFDEALEQITSSNGLARRVVNANTLLIYPALPNKTREYQDLTVRNFFVANADVKQLSNLLKTVLKVKDLFTDEKRNLIVIRDTPEIVVMAEKLVAAHDQPEPEVMLEVEILEFNHTKDDNLGVTFPTEVKFGVASPITLAALNAVNEGAVNVTGLNPAIAINLKRQIGDINLLANPRIRVRNREKAKFHIGDKVPVITSTTYPGTTAAVTSSAVSYLDVGIKLEFEPSIQLDDDVVIKTVLEVSSITNKVENAGTTAYQVGTRNATTTLTLRDGETQVLAGLLSTDETNTTNRLPGLGDIPVLGNLFSSRAVKGGRKEILLSITPRIVRNLHRPTEDLMEINFGPEAGSQGGTGQGLVVAQPLIPPPMPVRPTPPAAPPPSGLMPMVPFGSSAPQAVAAPVATPAPGTATTTTTTTSTTTTTAPQLDFEAPPGVGSGSR
jgi:general secretion pathway protein D